MNKPIAMRDALLESLHTSMKEDEKTFFVCADFGAPMLDRIRSDFPNRFLNVGVAEQNLINVSAGLALENFKVFAYAIAPFLTMRCLEQIRVNLALLSELRTMNVNLIGVGAGMSYVVSGPTHQCYEDISVIRTIPNISIYSPSDDFTSKCIFPSLISTSGIKYVRLDSQILPTVHSSKSYCPSIGFSHLKPSEEICIVSTGFMTHTSLKVQDRLLKKGQKCGLIDVVNITSFDEQKFCQNIEKYSKIFVIEEGFKERGGLDSKILSVVDNSKKVISIGVEPKYRFELGSREELHDAAGVGVNQIEQRIFEEM